MKNVLSSVDDIEVANQRLLPGPKEFVNSHATNPSTLCSVGLPT